MKNKFLNKYPNLREPQVGDVVKIIKTYGFYLAGYQKITNGDIGIIEYISTATSDLKYRVRVKKALPPDALGWVELYQFELVSMVDHEK